MCKSVNVFVSRSAGVSVAYRARIGAALEATPIILHLNRSLSLVNVWIPGAWLSENTLHGAYYIE